MPNAREWRDKVLDRAHFAATGGLLVHWFEDGEKVYGFKTAEQAAAFKRWVETCGIDWTTDPRGVPVPRVQGSSGATGELRSYPALPLTLTAAAPTARCLVMPNRRHPVTPLQACD